MQMSYCWRPRGTEREGDVDGVSAAHSLGSLTLWEADDRLDIILPTIDPSPATPSFTPDPLPPTPFSRNTALSV